jgi:uncharacterized membrane protein
MYISSNTAEDDIGMGAKIFLGLVGLIFLLYGLYCLVNPEALSVSAGVTATTLTGTIELQAMYGGLQMAFGAMCVTALARPALQDGALMAMLFLFAGLAVTRVSLGLTQGVYTEYNVFAMVFESLSLAFLVWWVLLRRDK